MNTNTNSFKNRKYLYDECITKNKKISEIAKELNTSNSVIYNWIRKFNIHKLRAKQKLKEKNKFINKRFGKLKIIRFCPAPKNTVDKLAKYKNWAECICDCGKFKITTLSNLKTGYYKSCGCERHLAGQKCKFFKGHEQIHLHFFNKIKRTANGGTNKRKRICKDFTITIEFLWDLYIKQNKKCALSGIDLFFNSRSEKTDGNISLDRIDSEQGYIPANVQWVHKDINIMKNKLNQNIFINYCKLIAKTRKTD